MLHDFRQAYDHHCEGWQFRAKPGEYRFELRHDLDQQDPRDHCGDEDHCRWIGHGFLDLGLERFALFLVGRDPVQQRVQGTGLLAGVYQVAVQLVEILRALAQRRGEAVASGDFLLHLVHQLAHVGVVEAFANDVERLQQRHASLEHCRHLAGEEGDIQRLDALALAEYRGGFLAHLLRVDALFAQLCLDQRRALARQLATHFRAFAVLAFPSVNIGFDCLDRHVQSLVTRLISSRLVTPCITLSSPDVRRSLKPSLRICRSISSELPSAMINRCSSGVFLTTS